MSLPSVYIAGNPDPSRGTGCILPVPPVSRSRLQVLVQAAVVLRDGHIVVVDHDDQVAVQFCRVVERFQRFAAAQRAVTDDSNHVAVLALEVAALGQTAGQADRGGGVTDGEMVVLALVRAAVAGHVVVVLLDTR